VLLYAAIFCILGFEAFFRPMPTLSFVVGSMLIAPLLFPVSLYLSIIAIGNARSIRKLTRSLREGGRINHKADWKRFYRTRMISMAILLGIMAPLAIGLPIAAMALERTEELPLENNDLSLVRLVDIEKDPLLERVDGSRLPSGVDWSNSVSSGWSPYALDMTIVREQGVIPGRKWVDGNGEYSPGIICSIYKLRFSRLADGVLNDLLQFHEHEWGRGSILEITDNKGFDRLYISHEQSRLEVLASKGNTVIWLQYIGEEDAQSVVEAIYLKIAG